MTASTSTPASAYHAQELLTAWTAGNSDKLQIAADGISTAGDEPSTAFENEKLELLREIAAVLQGKWNWIQPEEQPDVKVSLDLLRHLASA